MIVKKKKKILISFQTLNYPFFDYTNYFKCPDEKDSLDSAQQELQSLQLELKKHQEGFDINTFSFYTRSQWREILNLYPQQQQLYNKISLLSKEVTDLKIRVADHESRINK